MELSPLSLSVSFFPICFVLWVTNYSLLKQWLLFFSWTLHLGFLPSFIAWNMQRTKYTEDISVSLSYIWIKFNIILQNFGVSAEGSALLGRAGLLAFFLFPFCYFFFFFCNLAHSFSLDVMYFTSFLSESWRAHGFLVSLLKIEPLMRKQFLTAACSSLSFSLTTLPTLECPLAKWLE